MRLYVDTETYSEVDIKRGTYVYLSHPTTRCTVLQWGTDSDGEEVEDLSGGEQPSLSFVTALVAADEIVAHNAQFDRGVLHFCLGMDTDADRWWDTMIQAYVHGLPGALGVVGPLIGLPHDEVKDKRGQALIRLFCRPNKQGLRSTRDTHPEEWGVFLDYARQDIVALRALRGALPVWNMTAQERRLWSLDQRINERGFAVDVPFAVAAVDAVQVEQDRLEQEFRQLTSTDVLPKGLKPSQVTATLSHLRDRYGVVLDDLTMGSVKTALENAGSLPIEVMRLLNIRKESARSSVAKYRSLMTSVSSDDRLRGTMQFSGAMRTRRWSARGFQPQNLPRPSRKPAEIEAGIDAIKAGCADLVERDVIGLCSDALRGCIVAAPGTKLVVSDLSNIEGRTLPWLAGEQDKLDRFRDFDAGIGPDNYRLGFAASFGVTVESVTDHQRQIGKVIELALGYQGGVKAFLTFAAGYDVDLSALATAVHGHASDNRLVDARSVYAYAEKRRRTFGLDEYTYVALEVLKASWRAAHPQTVTLWGALKGAWVLACDSPGESFKAGQLTLRRDGTWMRVRLPGGGYLCYLSPRAEWKIEDRRPADGEDFEDDTEEMKADAQKPKLQLTYMGTHQQSRNWIRLRTYGGKLAENATQAVARDVMAENMPAIEDAGYRIVLSVHDEVVTETPDDPSYAADQLSRLLCQQPTWGAGLPLAAAGYESYRYRKG